MSGEQNKNTDKIKITIVDDEKELVETIRELLEPRGFIVSYAYDGKTAFDTIIKEKPDVVILDIALPDMDGRDVLIKLKEKADTQDIPVIILSGKDTQIEIDYGIELGAYDYVPKPYEASVLLDKINAIILKRKR